MDTDKPHKVDPKTQFENILDLDLSKCKISICVASLDKKAELPAFEHLQVTDELAAGFRDIVRDVLARLKKEHKQGELVLRPYDAGSKPDSHEVEHLDLSEHDFIARQIKSLSALAAMNIFQGEEEFISGLRFYVIVVQPEIGDPALFFRSYNKKRELSRSTYMGALLTQGHFDRVREPLLLFDPYVDCFSSGERMFIVKQDNFQKVFRFFEVVLKNARKTLKTIKTHVPIANFEEFEKACEGHLQKQSKLRKISERPYINGITIADLKKVIKQFNLPIKTEKKDGKEMLVYDPADKWALLRLLDDDYLKSLMTDQNYEVTGKRPH
jgi:hypothetical protein